MSKPGAAQISRLLDEADEALAEVIDLLEMTHQMTKADEMAGIIQNLESFKDNFNIEMVKS